MGKELWSEPVLSGVGCSGSGHARSEMLVQIGARGTERLTEAGTEGQAMRITKRWLCTGAIAVAVGAVPAQVGAQNDADIDGGRRLFQGMCVECHGAGGAGGDAPSLNRPRLNHAPDDNALASVIANGIPNTAMPRIRRFTESELKQLVAYVRS